MNITYTSQRQRIAELETSLNLRRRRYDEDSALAERAADEIARRDDAIQSLEARVRELDGQLEQAIATKDAQARQYEQTIATMQHFIAEPAPSVATITTTGALPFTGERHYPEEWGPSDNRQLTCSCGNANPAHCAPSIRANAEPAQDAARWQKTKRLLDDCKLMIQMRSDDGNDWEDFLTSQELTEAINAAKESEGKDV